MAKKRKMHMGVSSDWQVLALPDAMHLMKALENSQIIQGIVVEENTSDHTICIVDTSSSHYQINRSDVISIVRVGQFLSEVRIVRGARLWRSTRTTLEAHDIHNSLFAARKDEENIPPPFAFRALGDPTEGTFADQAKLTAGSTIEGAAKVFKHECAGKGSYENNCAHFLSNAFIRAGFKDFDGDNSCVEARCSSKSESQISECKFDSQFQYRVIRAKNMRCWFATKAKAKDEVSKGSGFWAIYQERPTDGQGHVAILDSNNWLYYGTGWYSKALGWSQECYQW